MIDARYCVEMARYNAWQNRQLKAAVRAVPADELTRERGAFFGTIFATLNHILWADAIWMARLTGDAPPEGGIAASTHHTPDVTTWEIARFRQDAAILRWAERLRSTELTGDLVWYSGATGREVTRPRASCVVHMFNHQTHHRGQIHAMLTQSGARAPISDLAFMPEDVRA